jgi:hypothetical protein
MFRTALIAGVATLVLAQDTEEKKECLYCKMKDSGAGALTSFSYCHQRDQCLQDAWNYFNMPCKGGFKRGNSYDLEFCGGLTTDCPGFASTPDDYQKYTVTEFQLRQNAYCSVKIDATAAVARVKFEPKIVDTLGIDNDSVKVDETYTIQQGISEVIIYNAAKGKPMSFTMTFSGASTIAMAAAGAALTSLMAF